MESIFLSHVVISNRCLVSVYVTCYVLRAVFCGSVGLWVCAVSCHRAVICCVHVRMFVRTLLVHFMYVMNVP